MPVLATLNSGTHQIIISYSSWSGSIKMTYDGRTMTDARGRTHSFQVIEDGVNTQYTVKMSGWTVFTTKTEVTRNGLLIFSTEEGFRPPDIPVPDSTPQGQDKTIVKEVILVVCPHCNHRNDASRRTCEKCNASI
ncbi:MAG: zinc finger Ran-binding domain-containing family 2 protein [Candidatus Thorarchaeota archaeon]|nr:zinc finger Ran-binding domain-containing family 2 protein [Candidatus Thorarchaeota archaeon]